MNPALVNEILSQQKELESLREQLSAYKNGTAEDCYKAVAGAADLLVAENEALRKQLDALVTAIDDQMVTTHLGTFSIGDDPKVALHKLMCWSQSVGEFFAKESFKTDQEPVAWMHPMDLGRFGSVTFNRDSEEQIPLYAHPVVSSEPVAWCVAYDDPRMGRIHSDPSMCEPAVDAHVLNCEGRISKVPLYLHPSRHLSDEELTEMWDRAWNTGHSADKVIVAFARAALEKANG